MQEEQKSFWESFPSWEEAERAWDEGSICCRQAMPLKTGSAANLPYIDPSEHTTALRLKGLAWVVRQDTHRELLRPILKNPLRHFVRYMRSLLGISPYSQEGDLFLYNTNSVEEFCDSIHSDETVVIVGFSYCQKPFECPYGRFSERCVADSLSPICRQCMIGKAMHALPRSKNTISVVIPTVHAIGKVILEAIAQHKNKRVVFVITSCHMALSIFADLGNMVNISGIGFRLQGRFCNTFKAFQLSEKGIKPGRTELSFATSKKFFDFVKRWRSKKLSGY